MEGLDSRGSKTRHRGFGREVESSERLSANAVGQGRRCQRRWFVTSFSILRSTRMPDYIPYRSDLIVDKSANRRWLVFAMTADLFVNLLTRTTQGARPLTPIGVAFRFGSASSSLVQILFGIRVEFLRGYWSCVWPRCRAKLRPEHLDFLGSWWLACSAVGPKS